MRIKHILTIGTILILSNSVLAQEKITLDKIRTNQPISVYMPLMMDSTNLKGDKFEKRNLLETTTTIPKLSELTNEVASSDTTQYLFLPKTEKGNSLQSLGFNINTDRYAKAKLEISSPSMFEVYIDGKKELSKTTVEDSLHIAKNVSKDLTIVPNGAASVVIKYLSADSNIAPEGIKVIITPDKKDSLANISFDLESKRLTKIQDIMEGVRINGSSLSPNGQFVLLRYRSVEKGGKTTFFTELLDTKTNRKTYLGELSVTWMPRTNSYYYTVKKGNLTQLITVDASTLGETVLANNIPEGSFQFAPNESYLLYTEKEDFDDRKGDLKLLGAPDDRQPEFYSKSFLHKYDLATGVKQRLTFGRNSTRLNDISFDSRYILFSTNEQAITEHPFRKSSMYKLDMETMNIDTLWTNRTFVYSAQFSPDAKQVLIMGAPEAFDGIGLNIKEDQIANSYDTQAFIMDLQSKKVEAITKNFDPSINTASWNLTDKLIYFLVTDKDYERIYAYSTSKKSFELLPVSEEVVMSMSLANVGNKISYVGMSLLNSSKAHIIDLKTRKSTLLSDPTKELFAQLNLGKVENWNFKASDGTIIEGRYHLPPNFDPSKKYPMIVYYYGGTTPTARTFEHPYSMHVYAALGYVVYTIQPSGAIGYGQEFSARHVNAWGKRTAEDIIEGTKKFAEDHSFVDASKIGCVGASYGGFMTMYLQTRTDIFAAAISHAGISSISSYWGEGYWGYSYSSGASAHSYPWNNKEMYVEQSPLFNADKINTPLLLLHGTEDTNVPMGESIQMYTALKILGRPVEFIQVKGENHGIAKYERRVEWNDAIYSWFAKWLKNESEWWNNLYPTKE